MVLDVTGDLFTHRRQLKHLVLYDRIVSLLGSLPILGCFVPEIIRPFHVVWSNEPRMVTARRYQTGLAAPISASSKKERSTRV
jgi:hypothetical protein